jgi:predicted Zn-dependent peptidase
MSTKLVRKTLNNGLKILMIPNNKFDSIAVGIFVKVGSRYETPKNNGISHFLEHMLFKDKKLVEKLDCLGAKYNAETSYENTHYYIYGSKKDYVDFIDIISDIYMNPFKKEDIEKEKGVIIEEYNSLVNDLDDMMNDEINRKLFNNSNLKLPIIGTKKNIRSFAKKDLESYWKKYYVPQNTLFVIAGNFNKKNAYETIQNKLGKIKNNGKIIILDKPKTIIQNEPKLNLIKDPNAAQSNIMITFRSTSMFEKKELYYEIISDILSSGCSSRLFKLLRDKMGIAYTNYSYNLSYMHEGVFNISVSVDLKKTKQCIDAIIKEIEFLVEKGITEKELNKSKKIRETNYMFEVENPLDIMNYFGFLDLFELEDQFKNLSKISVNNVNKIIKELFDKSNLNIFVYGII